MKILIVGDIHWSQYSSILRKRGEKYSLRLENLIQSVNWAERLAELTSCCSVVYLGDFFDKAQCNAEELSALNDVKWSDISHYFLCGNHETATHSLQFNTANVLSLLNNAKVIDEPTSIMFNDVELCFLPYIFEDSRKSISEYFPPKNSRRIICSHNDIAGYNYGPVISQIGFEVSDIEDNCDLYLNGHLHNGGKMTSKIINVGNLTGQNFSEDAAKYDHSALILDTDTLRCAVYDNPHALNFYKLDFSSVTNNACIDETLSNLKANCVATIKCRESNAEYIKSIVTVNQKDNNATALCNLIECRIIIEPEVTAVDDLQRELVSIDHLAKFNSYILETLGSSAVVQQELMCICEGV